MTRLIALLLFSAVSLMTMGRHDADARYVPRLKYSELFQRATLVVIANAVSTVDAEKDPSNNEYRVGVLTTLEVVYVIKGKHPEKKLVVFHYRFTQKVLDANGPNYVKFDTGVRRGSRVVTYMLFLTKGRDGRYVCVTGQTDPLFSVKKIRPADRE